MTHTNFEWFVLGLLIGLLCYRLFEKLYKWYDHDVMHNYKDLYK